MSGSFNPVRDIAIGKDKIISLVLPETAEIIFQGVLVTSAFSYFLNLKACKGDNISNIRQFSFARLENLTYVYFPKATIIREGAFFYCSSLINANFPLVTSILSGNVYADLTVTGVFSGCTSLINAYLPMVEEIGDFAFWECTSLTNVYFPLVTNIQMCAFGFTGEKSLSITLGDNAPFVISSMFWWVDVAKPVTVKVPSTATGYGTSPIDTTTENWGNAFRGMGWDGTNYLTGTVNPNINLMIEYF